MSEYGSQKSESLRPARRDRRAPTSFEVSSMRVRYGAVALPTVAMGASLLVGCNPSNEENLGGQTSKVVPHKEGIPDFKTYAEVQQYNAQQAAKKASAGK